MGAACRLQITRCGKGHRGHGYVGHHHFCHLVTELYWLCFFDVLAPNSSDPRLLIRSRSEVRAKKTSLTLNLGTNGLKVTSEPPPKAEQADCLQVQDRSAVTHPSSSHAQRCLIWLSCDNR
ncbi:hypothetical protein J6590_029905 [Homalodisca vitripennis]|nr:hypothetical protein J6590_029905 [Homalodisca vitripennis]